MRSAPCATYAAIPYFDTVHTMKIAILGFGMEGRSAFAFLKNKYSQARIEIRDKNISPTYLKNLEKFDLIVRSPGIKYLLPEIQHAKQQRVEISSATKLFFDHAKGTIIGITGTKGKGTTASMLYAILKSAGRNTYLVGNIGKPMLGIISRLKKNSISIVELSSFQLQDLDSSPSIAVVLEIAPDHLDYHKNMKEYVEAKSRIAAFQKRDDTIFYLKENKWSRNIAEKSKARKRPIDFKKPGVINQSDLKIPGKYNFYNAVVAASVASHLGIKPKVIKNAIQNFKGLSHHLELVRELGGVRYFNDSASTNPISTKVALIAIPNPKILIAGGVDKNFSYGILKPALKSSTKLVILYGASKAKIAREIKGSVSIKFAKDLRTSIIEAKKFVENGDSILFSPASASFDMFKNSKERGKEFSKIVKGLR